MKDQKALRNALLVALHKQSHGNLTKSMCVGDVCGAMGEKEENLEPLAPQLVALGWLAKTPAQHDPFMVFTITMVGIQEAEKMQNSVAVWKNDHPILSQLASSVVTAVTVALVLYLLGFKH